MRQGDGWQGAADLGPFDAINVGAAAAEVPPALLAQLRPGGLLLIPLGERQSNQELALLTARDGGVERRALRTVRFVPLVEDSPPAKVARRPALWPRLSSTAMPHSHSPRSCRVRTETLWTTSGSPGHLTGTANGRCLDMATR